MAERKPLVLIDGHRRQLPAGDSIDDGLGTRPEVTTNSGTDVLPVNQSGAKRTTLTKILNWIKTQTNTWTAKQTIEFNAEGLGLNGTSSALVGFRLNNNLKGYVGTQVFAVDSIDLVSTTETGPLTLGTNSIERLRITADGRVVIGGTTPSGTRRLTLDGSGNYHGLELKVSGIVEGILQQEITGNVYLDAGFTTAAGALIFRTAGGNERMRITGAGNVEHSNFTNLGNGAPAIKMKKLTGTTAASAGDSVNVAHGLTASKILSAEVLVQDAAGNFITDAYGRIDTSRSFGVYINTTNVVVTLGSGASNLLSRPLKVLLTYEQ